MVIQMLATSVLSLCEVAAYAEKTEAIKPGMYKGPFKPSEEGVQCGK